MPAAVRPDPSTDTLPPPLSPARQALERALPDALPSLASRPQPLPVTVDTPGQIEGGWPQPEATGLLTGRCTLVEPPQGWRREDIVGAVLKVSFEDWQGGMPLATSRQVSDYKRLTSGPTGDGEHTGVVYQRDEIDCLTGKPHSASLAVGGQRAGGMAPRLASLQTQGIVIDRNESIDSGAGSLRYETYQTRRLVRREYHAGVFELVLALNAETLQRLRADGTVVFFTGAEDQGYPLALRRATLSVTYGARRAAETQEGDTAIQGGLASMAGRWRAPDDTTGA
ncbi:hypothetical protein HLB44_02745 [Aquincola sp. S2]|uniref:Uncharacterized protein n=1 Tax=Pseudaquabacterium terrae TaxID=2732868 RepID=A0ABX2EA32_9BURK|nr:hypothetical protein [Aquabacterium terrae]NRF65899.1 hypothetical protein [Aquabacterium terrae]